MTLQARPEPGFMPRMPFATSDDARNHIAEPR
jgi:hypothetical protein